MTDEQKQQVRERIGGRVATLRKLKGMTQEQLAQEAGLQRTHVNRIEAGKYAVTIDVLREISVQSYIRCSRDRYAIENTQNP